MDRIFHLSIFENNDVLIIVALIFGILSAVSLGLFVFGKIKPAANLKELKARTKSWWVMSALFVGTTVFSTKISYIAIAFLSFVAFRECYSLLGFR